MECFTTYTGMKREAFTVLEKTWRDLGADHGEISSVQYKFYKDNDRTKHPENMQWWTMNPVSDLELKLTDFANARWGASSRSN